MVNQMDEKVEETTAEYKRRLYAHNSFFHYHRREDMNMIFTRKAKDAHATYALADPYTDAGSFQSRKYFTRPDYIIQNSENGGMQVRGQVPRMRLSKSTSLRQTPT